MIEIVLFRVLSAHSGSVSGNEFTANELKIFRNFHCGVKDFLNGFWIIFSEIRNGIMIRNKSFHQPHDFYVSLAFFFQLSRRTNSVEVAIEIKFKQIFWMIGWSPVVTEIEIKTKFM